MSFSEEVRSDLAKKTNMAKHCALAFLSAAVLFSGKFIKKEDGYTLFLEAGKPEFKAIYFTLLKKGLNISNCDAGTPLPAPETSRLLQATGITVSEDNGRYLSNDIILMQPCCRKSFLKGAFIAAGSVSDPESSYHFEIIAKDERVAGLLIEILQGFDLSAKKVRRKGKPVVYLKEAEDIASVLALMGADSSYLRFESGRVIKEMRGNINRRVNCETANIEKTVNASVKQVNSIKLIESKKGLKSLPAGLYEIANARLLHPELSLEELGKTLDPPIGKSGVNHRLRRLVDIAKEIERTV